MFFDKLSAKIGSRNAFLIIFLSIVLVAALVLVGVKLIPTVATKLDLTSNSMYTLSPETEKLIKSVDEKVTIYLISAPGEENVGIRTFLERYACKSKNITFKTLDTVMDEEEIFKYSGSTPPSNSVLVKTESRHKLIPYYDLFYFGTEAYNFAFDVYSQYRQAGVISSNLTFNDYLKNYAVQDGIYTGYKYEESVNTAIRYVTANSLKKVYLLAGHEEDAPSFDVYNLITADGIELTRINAEKVDIPADASLLLLFPNDDISVTEKQKITEYMNNGGKIFIVTTHGVAYGTLGKLLNEYGLESDWQYLCEDNENYNFGEMPAYTVPDVSDEGLAKLLEERAASILLAGTNGITLKKDIPSGITVTPLLTTSPESYTTLDISEYKFDSTKNTRKVRYTGVSAFNENGGGLVWISSPSILYEEYTIYTGGGNLLTLTYYINKLAENTPTEPIPAVMLAGGSLNAPKWFTVTFATVLCGVIPLGLMGFALYRKKRIEG